VAKPKTVTLDPIEYEVVLSGDELVVIGTPDPDEDEEIGHNCDAMGCGQAHVVIRAKITHIDAALAALTAMKGGDRG
jgi:hypothetical protein